MVPTASRHRPVTGSRLALLVLAVWLPGRAQVTALDSSQAGVDYKLQGEYLGLTSESHPVGMQVVARGGGKFLAVLLPGGLPGQGWDGTSRDTVYDSLQNGSVVFSGPAFSATISSRGDSLSGKTGAGTEFSLGKVTRKSPTLNAAPPQGAVVLFNGTNLSAWKKGTASLTADSLLKPEGLTESEGAVTLRAFQSFSLHLEFREPFMPYARHLQRGNSGVYLQGRDELQILDSFGAALGKGADSLIAKEECGAFFQYYAPTLNMSFPPLVWQTYDVDFTAAKYDAAGQTRLDPAHATVRLNGVVVEDNRALASATLLGDSLGPTAGPLRFQSHGDPVYYRNIWLVEKSGGEAVLPHRAALSGSRPPRATPWLWAYQMDGRRIAYPYPYRYLP